jgi:FAD dependent oxidoreductase
VVREIPCDVFIAGGGLGGVAAALAVLRLGRRVVIAEPTKWLGGQLTAQGVPPDEHPWIEGGGATASYRRFRAAVRNHYRTHRRLRDDARRDPYLNPGQGWVGSLCHEPRVGVAVLRDMLEPWVRSGRLEVLWGYTAAAATVENDHILSVDLEADGEQITVVALFFLDATEEGDLLPLARCEHVVGAESQSDTGEPHALAGEAAPLDQQAITWCFALEHNPDADHTIERPSTYGFWSSYRAPFWPGPHLGWRTPDPETERVLERPLFADRSDTKDLWSFRRIVYGGHYEDDAGVQDVTLVNWPQVDYWLGPTVGVSQSERDFQLSEAKELGRSFLYWLQRDAPRPDGGTGYPGLCLRGDVLGTTDGFAMRPYVRESRRIKAGFTVLENHVGVEARGPRQGAEAFSDSVGVGSYRIDLHPSTGGRGYLDLASWPFQIPLGALVPVRIRNLLPAAKNLGVTHITNGCFRLHPVEWNVGEAAGALAAYCIDRGLEPQGLLGRDALVGDFQRTLTGLGVQLAWPDCIRLHPR